MSLIKIPAVIKIPLYFQIRNKKSQNCLRLSLLNNKNKKLEKWRHCYQLFSDDSKSWLDCGSVKRELVSAQLFLGCKQGYWSISLGYWNSKVYMSRKVQALYEEFFICIKFLPNSQIKWWCLDFSCFPLQDLRCSMNTIIIELWDLMFHTTKNVYT